MKTVEVISLSYRESQDIISRVNGKGIKVQICKVTNNQGNKYCDIINYLAGCGEKRWETV